MRGCLFPFAGDQRDAMRRNARQAAFDERDQLVGSRFIQAGDFLLLQAESRGPLRDDQSEHLAYFPIDKRSAAHLALRFLAYGSEGRKLLERNAQAELFFQFPRRFFQCFAREQMPGGGNVEAAGIRILA